MGRKQRAGARYAVGRAQVKKLGKLVAARKNVKNGTFSKASSRPLLPRIGVAIAHDRAKLCELRHEIDVTL
jgi:hypothetical protein